MKECLTSANRQLVIAVDGEAVANVIDRIRVLVNEWDKSLVAIADRGEVSGRVACVIECMRPGVGRQERQPMRVSLLHLRLQRVISAHAGVVYLAASPEIREGLVWIRISARHKEARRC